MTEELIVNGEVFKGSQEDYDAIREAIERLSSTSQEQFEKIKKERWYNRVFDMITFSQKGKKRLGEQVGTIAQAQQIFIELLLRLSSNDANISKIVTESMNDIRRIQEQNIYLLSRINQLENISLGIRADMNIKNLSDKEKAVLSACLYTISDKNGEASERQKIYANTVISYLAVDSQMEYPTVALEEMDNDVRRKILACCMEYIFLKNCSTDSYNCYSDFIEEFDFGNKTVKGIEKQIVSLYNLRGCEGFYSKYKIDNFQEVSDIFMFELDDLEEEVEEIKMEDEFISSILQVKVGNTKIYQYKNVHLSAYINCEGSLEFEHCIIYYNESDAADEITLAKGARISIRNSIVVCKGYDKNHFISCEGDNRVIIESTTFIDCSYFLKSGNSCSFSMTKCELKNCFEQFISIYVDDESVCEISSNMIIQDDLNPFYINNRDNFRMPELINVSSYGGKQVHFEENVIIENPKFKKTGVDNKDSDNRLIYFSCDNAKVTNCSFRGISTAIRCAYIKECKFENCTEAIQTTTNWRSTKKPIIDNCVFKNCTNIIQADNDTRITNCQFVSCYNNLISSDRFDGGIYVEFCQFMNTKNLIDEDVIRGKHLGRIASIIFRRGKGAETNSNYLKKCIFDGVEIGDNFLIVANAWEKPSGTITYIEECDFKNCATKRLSGKIIKEYIQYDTLFKKDKDFHANYISNCRGLEKINKEGIKTEQVEVWTMSTLGNPIGSALASSATKAVAFAVGGPVGLGIVVGIKAVKKMVHN